MAWEKRVKPGTLYAGLYSYFSAITHGSPNIKSRWMMGSGKSFGIKNVVLGKENEKLISPAFAKPADNRIAARIEMKAIFLSVLSQFMTYRRTNAKLRKQVRFLGRKKTHRVIKVPAGPALARIGP
ncbi:hypothetical protein J7E23_11915 [Pseudomonas sp. ISL-88]|uniref:hypothetical protein n=1 Tax=Bacteria TaxID=2 RepID=UPI001BEC6CAB|nr:MULTISPECIES: hypothetical protein [Bacteria]MBT2633993.1 hypothetical protein [Bacillus sp. ISL-26]MBT2713550.1 hypothetical protein [Pseudomonas sp. ISL-88]